MKTRQTTKSLLFKAALAVLAIGASFATAQAAIVVSSSSGVYRYSSGGALEHTYVETNSNWQGVAVDNSTGNVYIADAANNGPLVQYAFNGISPSKTIMSSTYAGVTKATIGVTFNNGLVIANPYFYDLGAAEVSGFNPANPTDTTPTTGNSFYPSGATGITYSSLVSGRYYFTDYTGSVWQLNNFGVGGTPSATQISTGPALSGGIRGLALSADESTLWVADQSLHKVISINIATGVATDFITTGVTQATDVLRVGNDLFVSTSIGVDQYTTGGVLVANDLILSAIQDTLLMPCRSLPRMLFWRSRVWQWRYGIVGASLPDCQIALLSGQIFVRLWVEGIDAF